MSADLWLVFSSTSDFELPYCIFYRYLRTNCHTATIFLIKQLKFLSPNNSCKDYRIQCLVICNINSWAPVVITHTTTNWPHRYICTYITIQHTFSVRYLFTVTFFIHTWRLQNAPPLMTNTILCKWSRQLLKSMLIQRKKTLTFKIG